MRTEQEIRERIEEIERTNREDGWILGRELVRENQRVIDTLKWVLYVAKLAYCVEGYLSLSSSEELERKER